MENFKERISDYQPKPLGERRRYAVFIPLVEVAGEWHVLYQVRSQSVSQPGEVSFPGGRVDRGESAEQAAVREVMEELQLPLESIECWGELDFLVYQDQTIYCFVGQLHLSDWRTIAPNEEVDHLFAVPVEELIDCPPTHYLLQGTVDEQSDFPFDRIRGGVGYSFGHLKRSIPFYETLPENLWGFTAQLTERFVEMISTI